MIQGPSAGAGGARASGSAPERVCYEGEAATATPPLRSPPTCLGWVPWHVWAIFQVHWDCQEMRGPAGCSKKCRVTFSVTPKRPVLRCSNHRNARHAAPFLPKLNMHVPLHQCPLLCPLVRAGSERRAYREAKKGRTTSVTPAALESDVSGRPGSNSRPFDRMSTSLRRPCRELSSNAFT